MPASELLLSSFIANAAGTVDNWLAGLHFWHTINGAQWHGKDMLARTKTGVCKLVPISSKRTKRPPVTIEHLYALRQGLDTTNSFDAAVWAVACVAFWSCCRLGELIIPSFVTAELQQNSSGCGICLVSHPLDKDHTEGRGTYFGDNSRRDTSCPLTALKHHLACNIHIPSTDNCTLLCLRKNSSRRLGADD